MIRPDSQVISRMDDAMLMGLRLARGANGNNARVVRSINQSINCTVPVETDSFRSEAICLTISRDHSPHDTQWSICGNPGALYRGNVRC